MSTIFISRTYVEVTPESAEDGEFSDCGFDDKKDEVTFEELVKIMQEHPYPSEIPNNGGIQVWYSNEMYVHDYSDGTHRQESIHYHADNPPIMDKYWKWAAKIAGSMRK